MLKGNINISYINSENKQVSENLKESKILKADIRNTDKLFKAVVSSKESITLKRAVLTFPWSCSSEERIFMNGFQSWTLSRELPPVGKLRGLKHTPKFAVNKYSLDRYGDYHIVDYVNKPGITHGFSYCYFRKGNNYRLLASLSERSGYTIFSYDANQQLMTIIKDCEGAKDIDNYPLFDLALYEGSEDAVFDQWFKDLDIAPPKVEPMCGYTSWYNHYQSITEEVIEKDLASMERLPIKANVFQIDDGWEPFIGDWLSPNSVKFPKGMKYMADKIHEQGYLAGLWLAPFVCEKNSSLWREHPDWLVRGEDGEPYLQGSNWSSYCALDFYNPEVRDYLRKVFHRILEEWSFDLVKLDFLYAVAALPQKGRSRGQQMCEAMDFLRELVGDNLILGCGVPLMSAFGKVDFCRIGCDVGLDWDDKPLMRLTHRERVSTKNSIMDTIYRRQLNGRAFLNDPDVFLLRNTNIKLTEEQKEKLATVNGLLGSLWFTSDNALEYGENQKELYQKVLSLHKSEDISISDSKGEIIISYKLEGKEHSLKI